MQRTTREMLDQIDKFLSRGDEAAEELVDVLSALRGPDNGDYDLKRNTTERIRAAAFPCTTHGRYSVLHKWDVNTDGGQIKFVSSFHGKRLGWPNLSHPPANHFNQHAATAAKRLGILPAESERLCY
jgi:hypothetical protein